MQYININSSWVGAIAYADGNLYVRLKDGREYMYSSVSQSDFYALMQPTVSVGTYINQNIKPKYKESKL